MSAMMCRLLHCWQTPGCSQILTSLHTALKYCMWAAQTAIYRYMGIFFYTFLFVSALVFFITMRSLWYSQFFHLFYHICKAETSFQFSWKCFCCDLVCCKMEINPNALCLWICLNAQRKNNRFQSFFGNEWLHMVSQIWCKRNRFVSESEGIVYYLCSKSYATFTWSYGKQEAIQQIFLKIKWVVEKCGRGFSLHESTVLKH